MDKCKHCGQILEDGLSICESCKYGVENDKISMNFTLDKKREYKKCGFCNTKLSDFIKYGKTGCGQCYDAFRDEIKKIADNLSFGSTFHVGKFIKPEEMSDEKSKELIDLTRSLNNAIENDDFSKAHEIRMKINKIKEECYD